MAAADLEFWDYVKLRGFSDAAVRENAEMKMELEGDWRDHLRRVASEAYPERAADLAAVHDRAGAEGWDQRKFQLEMLRTSRPVVPTYPRGGSGGPTTDAVLSASLCRTFGLTADQTAKQFGPPVVDAAERKEVRGATLHTVFRHLLAANGRPVPAKLSESDIREALRFDLMAGTTGPSTGSPGILSAAVNKTLLATFMDIPVTWRTFARVGSLPDFKEGSAHRLTFEGSLAQLPPGGEIKHGTLTSESFTHQLQTWARMLGLNRRQLINDDLGALTQVPRLMARKAAISLEKETYRVFMNNSAFFTSGRGNVSTGAGSALSISGLSAAIAKLRALTDADGDPMLVTPTVLLVPPTLEPTARQLVNSMQLVGAPTTPVGDQNPWNDLDLQVVVSPYLEFSSLTGNSTTAWYVLSGPTDTAVVEVDFLNGVESPTVESTSADFNQLGLAWRVYWDYAANLAEYRGGIRSAGV